MDLQENIHQTLKIQFGLENFRGNQEQIILSILKEKSCLGLMSTGAGKSLCYQMAGLFVKNLVIVISPLISLIDDQIAYLSSIGISAAKIDSTQNSLQHKIIENGLKKKEIKFLFLSVERFENERFSKLIDKLVISLMVVDEAHCISQWGHNFRPGYLKIPQLLKKYKIKKILLLTATATKDVILDLKRSFQIKRKNFISSDILRENLKIHVQMSASDDRKQSLLQLLKNQQDQSTIIYVARQNTAMEISNFLNEEGINTGFYHGGLDAQEKFHTQELFMQSKLPVIVATIAFGMGINKADIRQIIHYNLPQNIESYYQEIGRAGRDGISSNCSLIASFEDLHIQKNFIEGNLPSYEQAESLIVYIQNHCSTFLDINFYQLSFELDLKISVLKTIFCYLEELSVLESLYKYHQFFEYRYLVSNFEIKDLLNKKEYALLLELQIIETDVYYKKTVDLSSLLIDGYQRDDVEELLNQLNDLGCIKLYNRRSKSMFKILSFDFNIHQICDLVFEKLMINYDANMKKLLALEKLLKSKKCYWSQISKYFQNKTLDPCENCSNCQNLSETIHFEPKIKLNQLSLKDVTIELYDLLDDNLINPHLIARYLGGLASPIIYKYQLQKTPGFGLLSQLPFQQTKAWVDFSYVDL
ncbi:RecQ family ATP-dependent DNA helicase [bacterium]|nr:RecQ family ATP-dependent DNA helicase [bacterium]